MAMVVASAQAAPFRGGVECHDELPASLAGGVLQGVLHLLANELAGFHWAGHFGCGGGVDSAMEQFLSRQRSGISRAVDRRGDGSPVPPHPPQYRTEAC